MKQVPLWLKILLVLSLLALAGVALSLIPTNTVAVAPHKPIDLQNRLQINDERPEPAHGHLFLVGVTEARVSLLQKWLLGFDPKVTFTPAQSNVGAKLDEQRDRAAIRQSKDIAAAAAFQLLGNPALITGEGASVSSISTDGPANGLLRVGDRIRRINNRDVGTAMDVTTVIGSLPPGSAVTFGIRRDNLPAEVSMRTIPPVAGDTVHKSRIGVALTTERLKITLPKEVDLATDDIVGPSAGLSFALAIYDAESAVDLLRGRYVVASGALSLDGEVLPVGGIRQKAIAVQDAGYDIFLVPRGNVEEATKAIAEFCSKGTQCTRILPVGSVSETVRYLELASRDLEPNFAN